MINKLVDWEATNMVSVMRELKPTKNLDLSSLYSQTVLKELGLEWPMRSRDLGRTFRECWPELLVKTLNMEVKLF